MNLSLHKIKIREGTPTSGSNGNRDFFDWLVPVLGRGLEPKAETMAYSVINRVSAGSRALANAASSEAGSISSKSSNSKPGPTEQPTSTESPTGSAACQKPAGTTWQNSLAEAESSVQTGGLSVPSQI